MSKHEIKLTDEELDVVTDVLSYAQDKAVTDSEAIRIKNARVEIAQQWADSREKE